MQGFCLWLRVARSPCHGDGDIAGAGVGHHLEALAVSDRAARAGGDGGAAAAWNGQGDAGQVTHRVRNRDRHLADRDMRARPPACRAELWWYSGQVPADRLAAALPAQHAPLFLQPQAGTGPALTGPAERAAGLLTVSRAAIGRQQPQQRPPVLITWRPRRSQAGNLPGHERQQPIAPWHPHHRVGGPASCAHSRRYGRRHRAWCWLAATPRTG